MSGGPLYSKVRCFKSLGITNFQSLEMLSTPRVQFCVVSRAQIFQMLRCSDSPELFSCVAVVLWFRCSDLLIVPDLKFSDS